MAMFRIKLISIQIKIQTKISFNSSILNTLKSEKGAGLPLFLEMIFFYSMAYSQLMLHHIQYGIFINYCLISFGALNTQLKLANPNPNISEKFVCRKYRYFIPCKYFIPYILYTLFHLKRKRKSLYSYLSHLFIFKDVYRHKLNFLSPVPFLVHLFYVISIYITFSRMLSSDL